MSVSVSCNFSHAIRFEQQLEGCFQRLQYVSKPKLTASSHFFSGIGMEGIACVLCGSFGSSSGTTTYSENIGAIGITKVCHVTRPSFSREVIVANASGGGLNYLTDCSSFYSDATAVIRLLASHSLVIQNA